MLFEEENNNEEAKEKEMMRRRIIEIIDNLKLDRASFADKIKMKPATLSHILTGRNDPSLNIAIQIARAYPQVSMDWLIKGTGEAPFGDADGTQPSAAEAKEAQPVKVKEKRIAEIRVFYDDNTFDVFVLKPAR